MIIEVKDYIILTWNAKYLVVKIQTNLLGNIMLITFSLNWIEPILPFSNEENLLVLFKHQDPFI